MTEYGAAPENAVIVDRGRFTHLAVTHGVTPCRVGNLHVAHLFGMWVGCLAPDPEPVDETLLPAFYAAVEHHANTVRQTGDPS